MMALAATRLVRGWNQTGQKFAGNPDIVKTFLVTNPGVLWFLVSATYLWIHRKLIHGFEGFPKVINGICTTTLIIAAFTFKLAFTREDAPELVLDVFGDLIGFIEGATLVSRARAVFLGLLLATSCVCYSVFTKRQLSSKASGMYSSHA
jgi:ethanolamine phosphate transferase 2 subunit G